MEKIIIRDAYENNLKHIDVEIPLNSFTCVTGCSGCGKSSLVFDTIYAESQRGFLEGMTGNLFGQKLMNKPKVGYIANLRPALNISQNYYNVNPRSTIGTVTEIAYYLRTLFVLLNGDDGLSEGYFSTNNPKSFCPNCYGLGIETVVSEQLLIPDKNERLIDGAILLFKGSSESKERKCLETLCEYYSIDIDKKVSELSKEELDLLLYSTETIKSKISYRDGKRRKQHYVYLQGAMTIIQEKIKETAKSSITSAFSNYLENVPCHICNGSKFKLEVLKYKVNDLNYSQVENMELSLLSMWLETFDYSRILKAKRELVLQLVSSIKSKVNSLNRLDLSYLTLNRTIPSLSGGERQRVRIATQLNCPLKGLIYILDEPCKGLHFRNIENIIQATRELINKGNTVIAIEHNSQYISSADNVIELGPVGGPEGGYLMPSSIQTKVSKRSFSKNEQISFDHYCEIKNIYFHNIKGQDVCFPIGGITCITGVSGSGKSSLSNVIFQCFDKKTNMYCSAFLGDSSIKRVVEVNQAPIGKTPRSTVVSYLEIFDEIRTLYARTETARKNKIPASYFSMNVKGGRCECCQGTGFQKIELNYLPNTYITCPECEGKRFTQSILSVEYRGKNIQYVLDSQISEIYSIFSDHLKISGVLKSLLELGLGYLTLGQMSMNLSGGEAQRIKLAKALGITSFGKNIFILDEPTSGLNAVDIEKFQTTLSILKNNKDTIVIIEHNIDFIKNMADYIVDFGNSGGAKGGVIVAQGKPEEVFRNSEASIFNLDKMN